MNVSYILYIKRCGKNNTSINIVTVLNNPNLTESNNSICLFKIEFGHRLYKPELMNVINTYVYTFDKLYLFYVIQILN